MSSLILAGDTSGAITLTVPATAGTNTITLPASTGTAITTASTSGIPNTINWTTVQTSSVSPAVAGTGYPMNTTSGALTVTLPASPTAGQLISIVDYAGTAATNNITINPNGNKIQGSTLDRIINTNREAINLVYVDSTQGWLAYSDVYSTTAPLPPAPYTMTYLVIAGGSAGGYDGGAGGGAGGLVSGSLSVSTGTVYTATVGAGSTATPSNPQPNGSNSSLTSVTTAVGGGGAGGWFNVSGLSGGSGGGAGANTGSAGAGTPGQGFAGGNAFSGGGAGGGGGAGVVGGNGASGVGGSGGNGAQSSITGTATYYAGGGAGWNDGGIAGTGGLGGGGNGITTRTVNPNAGATNTGSGGGGGGGSGNKGANGGSGVIILSVPTANYSGTTTGSPTITTSGANTVIKYTGSGTYTA
jgi:hypothetical protein